MCGFHSANNEIAEVRAKHRAEASALQAQLKREQLKVQSLEKSLDQKVFINETPMYEAHLNVCVPNR